MEQKRIPRKLPTEEKNRFDAEKPEKTGGRLLPRQRRKYAGLCLGDGIGLAIQVRQLLKGFGSGYA